MQIILAKYGEIILKGLNRPVFEDKLIKNIRAAVRCNIQITKAQATIYITPSDEDIHVVAERVSRVFGIVSVCVADIVDKNLEAIQLHAAQLMSKKRGTFKVEVKRADKRFPYKSPEIAMEVGGAILDANSDLTVDVHNPQTLVMVEVRDFSAYIYTEKIPGVGGIPNGTSGKAALLLSGGIDSPVAGYMIAKRGVSLECIHFFSYPYTSERAKDKVIELARILKGFLGKIKIHIVPFTDIQLQINDNCPQEQMTIIMRRFMMKISEQIAQKSGAQALITGESLGQVASQTLEGLVATDSVVTMPVFRPLIGMDKEEIVKISRKIGTFETSILPYEDCCTVFTPKHPNTKPKIAKLELSETQLDVEGLIQTALTGTEIVVI